jgi:AraC-like DNA-binding protein
MTDQLFQSELKVLGLMKLEKESMEELNGPAFKQYIKVLFLPAGYTIKVDMASYTTKDPSLFFIAPNQYMELLKAGEDTGYLIYYNRDFYCIQIHDKEVACDGLLFNNSQNIPEVILKNQQTTSISYIFEQIVEEFRLKDVSLEEMLRTYLKQLFIKATRLWKGQHLNKELVAHASELEFFRKFTILVDQHFKEKHNVADYAELLFMAPKTITHKFKRLNLPQPNDVIKERILLEAKRLLVHTTLTAKEIGYELGYEDPAYFSRLFVQKTGETPSGYRSKFLNSALLNFKR